MKLKEIHRTSTFAWSPTPSLPLLATGTVAGALDESFSNDSQLEIWAPDFLDKNEFDLGGEGQNGPRGIVNSSSRFNRLAWGYVDGSRPRGVIAAGMESGELGIWDPAKIVENADPSESLILSNTTHTGPIRGLDFNPIQTSLFSSGGVNGEIYIWDLRDPSRPYSPGTRSSKLTDITALAWNAQVQHVLATSSSSGYTVVWDLRGKREVVALAYGGGAGTLAGGPGGGPMGGRRGMSDVAWQPDNATRLVTSSEDDSSPVVMVWDLRNARAPEKILTGHEKGVLSLSWCKQDPDLLLSCGKDNRALCWNPQTSEIIGELPTADNWAFQVQWCPRNPDLFAAAFFDGTIGIHSVQSTNEPGTADVPLRTPAPNGADVFDVPSISRTLQSSLTLKQPPKWLRRPVSSSFGYGGKLVTVSNLPSSQGKNQSSVVHLRTVVTEPSIVERAEALRAAIEAQTLNAFAEQKAQQVSERDAEKAASWKALLSLFRADSRDELVTLLGFSKAEIAARVAEAVAKLKADADGTATTEAPKTPEDEEVPTPDSKQQSVVSFAEPTSSTSENGEGETSGGGVEATPSEVSATSDTTNVTRPADAESVTTTAPSLFGDDNLIGTPQTDAAADFFSTMGISQGTRGDHIDVPHTNYPLDSSVAATAGSGPSSVASESLKNNTFRIYPNDESDIDRLLTKALVLGDFESAVSLCLSADRFADAVLLAVKGGPELLQRTQKTYFERRTTSLPYLRLFQSIVTNDLADIVQNADLREWQEIFVVICTFANQEEFPALAEQLGQRLEFQAHCAAASEAADAQERAAEFRKYATLTYLAAGRLEKLVNIWIEELAEEERALMSDEGQLQGSRYTAHAHALQTFIEKVTVFRTASGYIDTDLIQVPGAGSPTVKTYKLSGLYDRYFEYSDLLAAQGLVKEAVEYVKSTPAQYAGSASSEADLEGGRERLLQAANKSRAVGVAPAVPAARGSASVAPTAPSFAPIPTTSTSYGYNQYAPPVPQQPPAQQQPIVPQPSTYEPFAPAATASPYAPAPTAQQPYNPYAPPAVSNQHAGGLSIPPPPRPGSGLSPASNAASLPPPPKRTANGGWNDAPVLGERRTPGPLNAAKPPPITSPFPNAAPSPLPPTPGQPFISQGQAPPSMPPPPRSGSVPLQGPPPPQQRVGPPPGGPYAQQGRPPSIPPSQNIGPPPSRLMSPPQPQGPPRGPPSQFTSPTAGPGQVPPQGPYARSTPPPGQIPGPSGPYARPTPPPGQGVPYARATPPPGQPQYAPPPPQAASPYTPPPGARVVQPVQPPNTLGGLPPTAASPPTASRPTPPPMKKGPPPPKYPPGDREHIPDSAMPIYTTLSQQLVQLKQTVPPQQKRLADDLERRINTLFDALNCETLSKPVVDQLLELTNAMAAHDRETAMAIHMDLLTRGSLTDDIGLWMSSVKQLIMRL